MLGTNIETLEDLLVTNNKTIEALDQIQNEMETLNEEAKFKNICNEIENVTNSNDNLENDFNEESNKVIVVTGGETADQQLSAEVLNLDGTRLCLLPDLPTRRRHHMMSGG